MQLKICQKYFSIGDKFNITDENDQTRFLAKEELFSFHRNAHLFGLNNMEICRIEGKIFSLFGQYNIIQGDNVIGYAKRRPDIIPFIKIWRMEYQGKQYVLRTGGYKCKICAAEGEKYKHDRKNPLAIVSKKLAKLRDTYVVDFDPNVLDPTMAALIGLFMDLAYHKKNH